MSYPLFVYGTLRKDYIDKISPHQRGHGFGPHYSLLQPYTTFKCYAKVQGLLYDFGPYPGLIDTQEPDRFVFGELHQVFNENELWPPLDEYEGCGENSEKPYLFIRRLTTAFLDTGTQQRCWTYYYSRSLVPSARLIETGDYLRQK